MGGQSKAGGKQKPKADTKAQAKKAPPKGRKPELSEDELETVAGGVHAADTLRMTTGKKAT